MKEVIDYGGEHGQDTETLKGIYVFDDRGNCSTYRIREFCSSARNKIEH